jgi:hypothetical protein
MYNDDKELVKIPVSIAGVHLCKSVLEQVFQIAKHGVEQRQHTRLYLREIDQRGKTPKLDGQHLVVLGRFFSAPCKQRSRPRPQAE